MQKDRGIVVFLWLASKVARRIFGANCRFGVEIAHSEKSLISVFQDFSATINKAFILAGVLGTGLSFYGV